MYRCPVCTAALDSDRTYRCPRGQAFDIAREGYVNLLAGRASRRRLSGDEPSMAQARRVVLDAGYFDPLRSAVLTRVDSRTVLDVGCGEGFYTRPLGDGRNDWIGAIDLSKLAMRLAARRALAIRPGGRVIAVAPGPAHLAELKRVVFDEVIAHSSRGPSRIDEVADRCVLTYQVLVEQPSLSLLLDMTPYRWQVSTVRTGRLAALRELEVTLDFLVLTFEER